MARQDCTVARSCTFAWVTEAPPADGFVAAAGRHAVEVLKVPAVAYRQLAIGGEGVGLIADLRGMFLL